MISVLNSTTLGRSLLKIFRKNYRFLTIFSVCDYDLFSEVDGVLNWKYTESTLCGVICHS